MTSPIRIVIADDHAIFRQGLSKLFEEQPEFVIVGEAATGIEAIEVVNAIRPDILLLDLQLGDMTGLDVLRRIGTQLRSRTIILGADIQREDELNAIMLGASGVVGKSAAAEMLFKSIRSVIAGQLWVKRDIVRDLLSMLQVAGASPANPLRQFGLTGRELEVVRAVVQGQRNREISKTLGISPFTVKHYLTRIFDKLNVSNRLELALFATRQGLARNSTTHARL